MSTIAEELTRIQTAKASLATSIAAKGVTVPAATKIDGYSALVDEIAQGGGLTKIEGTITPSSDTWKLPITDERLQGKTLVIFSIWSENVALNTPAGGNAGCCVFNPNFLIYGEVPYFTNNQGFACFSYSASSASGTSYGNYGARLDLTSGISVFTQNARNYIAGETYKWVAYVI